MGRGRSGKQGPIRKRGGAVSVLVNARSGRRLVEFGEAGYDTIADAVIGEGYQLDDRLLRVYIAGGWHDYYDLATEREMSYREYKTNYSDLRTKKGSYNAATKTIVVYLQDEDQRDVRKVLTGRA